MNANNKIYKQQQLLQEKLESCEIEKKNMDAEIQQRVNNKKQELEEKFEKETIEIKWIATYAVLYSICCTICGAFTSVQFILDFKNFILGVWTVIDLIFSTIIKIAMVLAKIADIIPNKILAFGIHWVMIVVFFVCAGLGIAYLFILLSGKAVNYYRKGFNQSCIYELCISVSIGIYFADSIHQLVHVNVIVIIIILHIIYILLRLLIKHLQGNAW